MGKTSIAETSVKISADNSSVAPALRKTEGDLRGFAGKAKSSMSSLGGLAKAGAVGLVAGLGAGIAIQGTSAITEGVGALVSKGMERLPEIGKIGTTAQAFGLDTESWSRMAGAAKSAGGDTREFVESMVTLNELGTNAANGTETAAKAFRDLGLDAQKFQKLPIDEKFYAMQDALSKVDDAGKRLAIGGIAYGTDGLKNMLPIIAKNSTQVKELGASFVKSGADVAQAQLASEAMTRATASMDNAFDNVLIALSPVFQYIADLIPYAIEKIGPKFSGMQSMVIPAMRACVVACGYLVDGIKGIGGVMAIVGAGVADKLSVLVLAFQGTIESVLRFLSKGFKLWKSILAEMPTAIKMLNPGMLIADNMPVDTFDRLADSVWTWGAGLENARDRMKEFGESAIDGFGESAASARKFFDDFDARRTVSLAKRTAELNKRANPVTAESGMKDWSNKAALSSSTDAVSAIIKAQVGATKSEAKLQLDATRDITRVLDAWRSEAAASYRGEPTTIPLG